MPPNYCMNCGVQLCGYVGSVSGYCKRCEATWNNIVEGVAGQLNAIREAPPEHHPPKDAK